VLERSLGGSDSRYCKVDVGILALVDRETNRTVFRSGWGAPLVKGRVPKRARTAISLVALDHFAEAVVL
jgi:hypothetical protein